jgi:hypothetical protein
MSVYGLGSWVLGLGSWDFVLRTLFLTAGVMLRFEMSQFR